MTDDFETHPMQDCFYFPGIPCDCFRLNLKVAECLRPKMNDFETNPRGTVEQLQKRIAELEAELDALNQDVTERLQNDSDTIHRLHTNLAEATRVNDELRGRMQSMTEALEFYADPDTYFAVEFLFDPPCGRFRNDFSEGYDSYVLYNRPMPGKLARQCLGVEPDEMP